MKTYPKYKDSNIPWIGRIPKHWGICRLKDYALICNGQDYKSVADDNGAFPVIGSGGEFARSTEYLYKGESVLLGRKGTIDKPLYINGAFWTVDTMYYTKINKLPCGKYFYYLCNTIPFDFYQYGSAVPSMTQTALYSVSFPYPPLPEQTAIAAYLDRKCSAIDRVIEAESRIIEKLKEYRQSLITETVSHGLNPHAPMKASGIPWIGRIPKHWEIKRLKFVATSLIKGNGITKDEVLPKGDIQCIRYGEIYSKYDGKCSETFSSTNLNLINSPVYVQKGDILFAGTGELIEEIGKNIVYMGDKACLAGGDIVILRHNQDPIFLNYALGSSYAQGQKSFGKSKLKVVHISAEQIGNMIVALPPLSEQKSIADFLDKKCSAIDSTISKKQQIIEKMTEYNAYLLYEHGLKSEDDVIMEILKNLSAEERKRIIKAASKLKS